MDFYTALYCKRLPFSVRFFSSAPACGRKQRILGALEMQSVKMANPSRPRLRCIESDTIREQSIQAYIIIQTQMTLTMQIDKEEICTASVICV